jgi:fumarylacetoacetase
MTLQVNATHDPQLHSWVASANLAATDFPIQNLPFGIFRRAGSDEAFRGGVAIGDQILDLRSVASRAIFEAPVAALLAAAGEPTLNRFMSMGPDASSALRQCLSSLLRAGSPGASRVGPDLVAQSDAEYALPAAIGDYTDFYSSIHHATTVGRQFRPDNPLLPNYKWVPIAYHGRSSSIQVSGHSFPRPCGQRMADGASIPDVGPTRRLDFELEVGIFVGGGNPQGVAIEIGQAESHVFGLCLLNDWSARDIQGWEYQPLGPFLSKNFSSTISPWVVTLEALAPFRQAYTRPVGDPQPLAYLDDAANRISGALDIILEAGLQTAAMRQHNMLPERLALSNFRHGYWTIAQMLAHHTVGGCNLRPGDLLGSGTLSGPEPDQAGSLLELTAGGHRPLVLESSETRAFLEDGDRVVLRAWCERPGHRRIGFGSAEATVMPATQPHV